MSEAAPTLDEPWITAPESAAVLDALEAEGGPDCARFVGGCVRNAIMGRRVEDVDIATVLRPDRVSDALRRAGLGAYPTGVEHGTVTATANGQPFEITTLRRDVETDGRRAVVAYTEDWAEDAQRRDFRLNALYADRCGKVFDPVGGGLEDARDGRIVFVGDAETRIREDYLRILRFFRFQAWYSRGDPDETGLQACARLRGGLHGLSGERLSKELLKLLAAVDPRPALRLMLQTGVMRELLPFVADRARFERMVELDADPELRLAALLPDDARAARALTERFRLSNAQRDRLTAALSEGEAIEPHMPERAARSALYRLGAQTFTDRLKLAAARDGGDPNALLATAEAWTRPKFPLGGDDMAAVGVPPGPEVGRRLRALEAAWLDSDFQLSREELLRRAGESS